MSNSVTVKPYAEQGNYTQMHNVLFDYFMPSLPPNAWKIICLVVRCTTGLHRSAAGISYRQILRGTGIKSSQTVSEALKYLTDANHPHLEKTPGDDWEACSYTLNKDFEFEVPSDIPVAHEILSTLKIKAEPTLKIKAEPTLKIKAEPTLKIKALILNKEKVKKDKDSSPNGDMSGAVVEVFSFWQETLNHKSAKLTPERKAKIRARLKEGYTVEQIKRAITGCSLSPYHMGENQHGTRYTELDLICRNGSKLEQFIGYADAPPKQNGNGAHPENKSARIDPRLDVAMSSLCAYFGKRLTDEERAAFCDEIAQYPIEKIESAFQTAKRQMDRFPRPLDLRDYIERRAVV